DGDVANNEVDRDALHLRTWNFRDAPPADRLRVVVHEYAHLWQANRAELTPVDSRMGPAWLIEGSANVIAFHALADAGVLSTEDADAYLTQVATGSSAGMPSSVPSLAKINQEQDLTGDGISCCSYATVTLAVELLTKSTGIKSLDAYFRAIGAGQSWPAAF